MIPSCGVHNQLLGQVISPTRKNLSDKNDIAVVTFLISAPNLLTSNIERTSDIATIYMNFSH